MNDIDKVRAIDNKFKSYFSGGFHNVLWQIIVNKAHEKKLIAFSAIVCDSGVELVVSLPDGGYIPACCYFNDDVNFMKGNDIAEEISEAVFEIDRKEVLKRIALSYSHNGRQKSL